MRTTEHTVHLGSPGDLLEGVPYLLGFHPELSVVLVGLTGNRVVVTLRFDLADLADLADAADPAPYPDIAAMLGRAAADRAVIIVYGDLVDARSIRSAPLGELPHQATVSWLEHKLIAARLSLLDSLLVADGRWWSYLGRAQGCDCCGAGELLPGNSSSAAADAVFAGLSAQPNRDAFLAILDPVSEVERQRQLTGIHAREDAMHQAAIDGQLVSAQRSTKRALFAAAREADRTLITRSAVTLPDQGLADPTLCRYAVGLSEIAIRDALWLAIDQRRLSGRGLWQVLLQRLPAPYDSPALFLFGWDAWREGNGPLAMTAAQRALESNPGYTAAELLASAVGHGLDPYRTPRLRVRARR